VRRKKVRTLRGEKGGGAVSSEEKGGVFGGGSFLLGCLWGWIVHFPLQAIKVCEPLA